MEFKTTAEDFLNDRVRGTHKNSVERVMAEYSMSRDNAEFLIFGWLCIECIENLNLSTEAEAKCLSGLFPSHLDKLGEKNSATISILGKDHPIFGINAYNGTYVVENASDYVDSLLNIIYHLKQNITEERHEIFNKFVSQCEVLKLHHSLQDLEETIEQAYIKFLDYEQRKKWFPYIAVGTSILMLALLNFLVKW